MNFFEFYIDEKGFEYDEREFGLRDYHVDHRDYKQDIPHTDLHDEYEQDRTELNNYPRNWEIRSFRRKKQSYLNDRQHT